MKTQVLAALEESLAATPDPTDVLRGVHAGIARRTRRNRSLRTGFTIAFILIVSLVVGSIAPQSRERAPAGIPVGEWRNTIRPTWLPAGFVAQAFTVTRTKESIQYHSRDANLSISVSAASPLEELDPQAWRPIEINGRSASEFFDPRFVELVFQLPSGRWAKIGLSSTQPPNSGPAPEPREDALRIARSLEETGDLRLRTSFVPSYLPADQHVVGVKSTIFLPAGFGTIVCAVAGQSSSLSISLTNVVMSKSGNGIVQIADIQGRSAYWSEFAATVFVPDFHGGTLAVGAVDQAELAVGDPSLPARLPLEELVKIAEGVIWAG